MTGVDDWWRAVDFLTSFVLERRSFQYASYVKPEKFGNTVRCRSARMIFLVTVKSEKVSQYLGP
jgi:hypothetical protein